MPDDLERVVRVGLLFDYYGPLLTARQREAVDLYYLQNWSLHEIAEAWATSRQAVHDLIGRSVRLLEGYEKKLGLERRERRQRAAIAALADGIEEARSLLGRDDARAGEILQEAARAAAGLNDTEKYDDDDGG
ncbi:MAG: YlxM family DNA-binding protein [Patescibacteria group bacterium]